MTPMTDDRPNILLICTDQQRWDFLSCYQDPLARTPTIQRLADEGAVYEHCYTTSTVCSPARASLATGKHPQGHGLWANGVGLPDSETVISRELADSGYRCGLVGKMHLSRCFQGHTEHRLNDGFEFYAWAHDPFHGSPENRYHHWLSSRFPELWKQAESDRITPASTYLAESTFFDHMPTEAHYSTWVADEAQTFLSADDSRPFFLWLNFYDPHHPFEAPDEYLELFPPGSIPPPTTRESELDTKPRIQKDASARSYNGMAPGFLETSPEELDRLRRAYYAMVAMLDDKIAQVLRDLEQAGKAESTLVIFTSDHGEMLGDHQLLLKGPMLYDPAVRVPLLIRWPTVVPPSTRISSMVSLIDIHRTIAEAAGLTTGQPGAINLTAVARGEAVGRSWALTTYRNAGHPYSPPVHSSMFRTHTHKLIVWHGRPATDRELEGELYDLRVDPSELNNLWDAPDYQGQRTQLLGQLLDVLVSVEDRSKPREAAW